MVPNLNTVLVVDPPVNDNQVTDIDEVVALVTLALVLGGECTRSGPRGRGCYSRRHLWVAHLHQREVRMQREPSVTRGVGGVGPVLDNGEQHLVFGGTP